MVRDLRLRAVQVGQEPAQRSLRRGRRLGRVPQLGRDGRHRLRLHSIAAQAVRGGSQGLGGGGSVLELLPGVVRIHARGRGQFAHLRTCQLGSMVAGVALRREAATLDRVREDDGGAGVVDAAERVDQLGEVVAGQIADDLCEVRIRMRLEQARERVPVRALEAGQEALAHLVRVGAQ